MDEIELHTGHSQEDVEQSTIVETETAPVETETAPVETETAPVETGTAPVETGTAPVATGTAPVETETAPVETGTAPVETETAPVETETAPVETGTAPVETGTAPVETGTAPVEMETAPVETETPSLEVSGLSLERFEAFAQDTEKQFQSLESLFQKRILHAQGEEKSIDKLHKELEDYKSDFYAQLIQPILKDLIDMRESILRASVKFAAKPEGEQAVPLKTFSSYSEDLEIILDRYQVEVYQATVGEKFDALRQRLSSKVPTTEEALHGTIAESVQSGYAYGKWILSHEKVRVYAYEAPKEAVETAE